MTSGSWANSGNVSPRVQIYVVSLKALHGTVSLVMRKVANVTSAIFDVLSRVSKDAVSIQNNDVFIVRVAMFLANIDSLSLYHMNDSPSLITRNLNLIGSDFNRFGFNSPKLASFLIHKV